MDKINQFDSDFLYTTPAYLTGAANVFNLAGNFFDYNLSETAIEADYMALANDFATIGKDLEKSIESNTFSK